MFEGATERKMLRAIIYVSVFILIAFMAFVNLIFGIKFSTDTKNAWLLGVATGIFTGAYSVADVPALPVAIG
jgi:hypothetical protein